MISIQSLLFLHYTNAFDIIINIPRTSKSIELAFKAGTLNGSMRYEALLKGMWQDFIEKFVGSDRSELWPLVVAKYSFLCGNEEFNKLYPCRFLKVVNPSEDHWTYQVLNSEEAKTEIEQRLYRLTNVYIGKPEKGEHIIALIRKLANKHDNTESKGDSNRSWLSWYKEGDEIVIDWQEAFHRNFSKKYEEIYHQLLDKCGRLSGFFM